MTEVFRFMSIRSVQLAEQNTAIDLSTYLSAAAAAAPAARGAARRRAAQAANRGRMAAIAPAAFGAPKPSSALKFAEIYAAIGARITVTAFDAATLGAVISQAIGRKALADWVKQPNYLADKNDAAVALIAAHLKPPADRTVDTLATYVRIMHLLDALAGGAAVTDTPQLRTYMSALIMAPSGVMPLIQVGPPYNPYVIPAGVADLQVVKQELIGYDKKEISYIANVLQSETNKRITVRFEKTDQTFTTTTDTTTQTEQDTQSAERFQVQTQAQKTIQDDSNLKFGLSVSASYGPSVNVKSNFDYGSSQATSVSDSVSTSYGKDVTTRSVNKVTQEVTQQQRLDIINSFREKIIHGYDNSKGTANISGVYQYVDALYDVGVFNYGKRLLLDLVVPDPAALVRDAMSAATGGAVSAYDPPSITFTPSELTLPITLLPVDGAGNPTGDNLYPNIAQYKTIGQLQLPNGQTPVPTDYTQAAEIYQVSGLKAPPDPVTIIARSYQAQSSTSTGAGNIAPVADTFQIPAGYEAIKATVIAGLASMTAGAPAYNLSVTVGNQFIQWGNGVWASTLPNSPVAGVDGNVPDTGFIASGTSFVVDLANERNLLGITVGAGVLASYQVSIEVTCVMTDEAFAQWQLDTFSSIQQAYLALLSSYQQAVGQAKSGTGYPGSNPDENLRVMQIELKRAVISMVTLNQFNPPTAAPAYAAATTYAAGAVVAYGGATYVSLQGANQGNQPDISPGWWSTTIVQFNAPQAAATYVSATTYASGTVVTYNNTLYLSLQDGNLGHQPDQSPMWWGTDTMTYVDPNLPPWSGQGNPSTASALNFPALFTDAPVIRFMEEAFEWEQMQYIFYPYYWNSKSVWFDLSLLEDPDPLFAQFLRAGASRVVVPVRPGFEQAFIYFLQTGQPWDGGTPPQVYDPLYLSIATEIEEADQMPMTETLIEPTWTMRLPTTLTMLRSNTPNIAPYSANATYPIGAVVTSGGIAYMASQMPYEPGEPYGGGAVVSYADVSYTSEQAAYAVGTTYALGAVVIYNGVTYTSLQAANTGNSPDTSPAWWSATPNVGNEPDISPAWWAATPNTGNDPASSPQWWTPTDPTLPSWTLDPYMNVTASN